MKESVVMDELRIARDRISEDIKDMNATQMKEYFSKDSEALLKELEKLRAQKSKAV